MAARKSAPAKRRPFTATDRIRAVKLYHARGNRSEQDIAAEVGVTLQLLRFWVKCHAEGVLDGDGSTCNRPPPSELAHAPIVVETCSPSSAELTRAEREELVLLRFEVRRLRRALAAYAELREP